MLHEREGRVVIECSRCPVRLDLGLKAAVHHRNRMPSLWTSLGEDRHLCPSCAQNHGPRFGRSAQSAPLYR